MLRRVPTFLVLAFLPGGLAAYLLLVGRADPIPWAGVGYGILVAALASFVFRPPGELRALAGLVSERERELNTRRAVLQARIDFLSAEREISLVLNEDVEFQTILERVLAITCDTLGGDAELWMLREGKVVPRAARVGGKTEFDPAPRDERGVRQCFEDGRLIFEAEEGRCRALAPLQADREIIGVVRVTIPLETNATLRQERSRVLQAHLQEFSKFLGLALKTPDLYTRAVQDGLTGLWTKRHFFSQAPQMIEASRRYGEPLSLIMVDVDHFKKVNDTHGHPAGDRVLQGVAEILRRNVRGGSAFRYGGEEMAVILPKADAARAAEVAERLRRSIESRKVGGIRVTASFGVAQGEPSAPDLASLVERADRALYAAKQGGRNRVVTAEGATQPTASPR